jgi:PAS domain S-box-containing protein
MAYMLETRRNEERLPATLAFLNGGGEMGGLIRAHDWNRSPLGPPEHWPQPLRTALRVLLNTGHPMYIWWGPDLLCFYNDAYRRSIGPERHPCSLGQPGREVWGEIWDIIGPQIDQVMAGGGATWQENALIPITRNGRLEEVYWTYSYGPIDDEDAPDGIGGVLVVCTETTEQVLSRRRASEDIEHMAQLFEQAPGFVAVLRGADHVFELANPAYIKLVGRSDLIGRPVRAVFPDLEGQGFFERLDNVFNSGETYSSFGAPITLQPSPDRPARRHLTDFVYQPIKDRNGVVTGIFVQGSDVTERAAAEAANRESEARLREIAATDRSEAQFRLLVRGVTDYAIYMLDPEGLVSSWNPGAQRIKGYAPEEVIGQHFSKFYTEEDRASGAPQRGLDTARREGRFEIEGWRVRKDGTRFRAHAIIDAIRGEDGEVIGFAKITRDITEREEARRALERAREALFQAQKLEAIGQLTGGIAHDFNNLLMAVLGSLELARKRLPDDPQVNGLISNAIQGAQRGAALTQRMLTFARRQELKREPIDLAALVVNMEPLLSQSLGPLFTLSTEFAPHLPAAETDRAQLESALMNVVINARDAMPRGGTIALTAAPERIGQLDPDLAPGDYVRLTISDQGEGMSEETLARATEPFFTTKGVGKGTGLGLAMVQGLAAQSGGTLRIKSRVDAGTEVELWLPATSRHSAAATVDEIAAVGAPSRPLTILAVEDDPLILLNLVTMLEDLGHKVVKASSGPEALRALAGGKAIDMLITDHSMPGMTGAELAQKVAAERADLPIILASGYAELPAGGNVEFVRLAKPFGQKQLADAIERVLRAAPVRGDIEPTPETSQ